MPGEQRKFSKIKAIHDALEFYAKLDCEAGLPPEASPALVAMSYAKELIKTDKLTDAENEK